MPVRRGLCHTAPVAKNRKTLPHALRLLGPTEILRRRYLVVRRVNSNFLLRPLRQHDANKLPEAPKHEAGVHNEHLTQPPSVVPLQAAQTSEQRVTREHLLSRPLTGISSALMSGRGARPARNSAWRSSPIHPTESNCFLAISRFSCKAVKPVCPATLTDRKYLPPATPATNDKTGVQEPVALSRRCITRACALCRKPYLSQRTTSPGAR